MRLLLALLLSPLLVFAVPAPALAADSRIQTVDYDPDRIVRLRGQFNIQTMIEFEPSERIENVAVGDALGWQVTPNKRANKLFVKPVSRGGVTNMTVVTDRRRYAFSLSVAAPAPWVLRFRYPAPVLAAVMPPPAPPPVDPSTLNRAYTMTGDAALFPAAVWDDGAQTYFQWPAGAALPAIFAVTGKKTETIVNFVVRGDTLVVQQVASRFMLRLGKASATVTGGRS
jgi:type IV secretion system protein VirB9